MMSVRLQSHSVMSALKGVPLLMECVPKHTLQTVEMLLQGHPRDTHPPDPHESSIFSSPLQESFRRKQEGSLLTTASTYFRDIRK